MELLSADMIAIRCALILFTLLLTGCESFPSGAGDCPQGQAAVTGHNALVPSAETGLLSANGFTLAVDGLTIPDGGIINVAVGTPHTFIVSGNTFRGHLIRINVPSSALTAGDNSATASVCGSVAGITHSSSSPKTSASGTLLLTEQQSGIPVDVTLVVKFEPSVPESVYFYSSFTLNALPQETESVAVVIERRDELSTLLLALQTAGLDTALQNTATNFTVLAPSNSAFDLISGVVSYLVTDPWILHLQDVLLYHVIPSTALSSDLFSGRSYTSLNQENITANFLSDGTISFSGAYFDESNVTVADLTASNGVVHQINRVLLPASVSVDLLQVLENNSADFSVLLQLLSQTGLDSLLQSAPENGIYTILAPSNSAFSAVPEDLITYLSQNAVALQAVLQYHVLPGLYPSVLLQDEDSLATALNGQNVTVTISDNDVLSFNDAIVSRKDLLANNGLIYELEAVLLPSLSDVVPPSAPTMPAAPVTPPVAMPSPSMMGPVSAFNTTVRCIGSACPTVNYNGSEVGYCPDGFTCKINTIVPTTGAPVEVYSGCRGYDIELILNGSIPYDLSQPPCSCNSTVSGIPCDCMACPGTQLDDIVRTPFPFLITCANVPVFETCPPPTPSAPVNPPTITSPISFPSSPITYPIAPIPPSPPFPIPPSPSFPTPVAPVQPPVTPVQPPVAPLTPPVFPIQPPVAPVPISQPVTPVAPSPVVVPTAPVPPSPTSNTVSCLPSDCKTLRYSNGTEYEFCSQGLQCTLETTAPESGLPVVVSYGCRYLNPEDVLAGNVEYDLAQQPCSCGAVYGARPCNCRACFGATNDNVVAGQFPFILSCDNFVTIGDCTGINTGLQQGGGSVESSVGTGSAQIHTSSSVTDSSSGTQRWSSSCNAIMAVWSLAVAALVAN